MILRKEEKNTSLNKRFFSSFLVGHVLIFTFSIVVENRETRNIYFHSPTYIFSNMPSIHS